MVDFRLIVFQPSIFWIIISPFINQGISKSKDKILFSPTMSYPSKTPPMAIRMPNNAYPGYGSTHSDPMYDGSSTSQTYHTARNDPSMTSRSFRDTLDSCTRTSIMYMAENLLSRSYHDDRSIHLPDPPLDEEVGFESRQVYRNAHVECL